MRSKLSVVDGEVLEESVVEYVQGSGKMLPGLEAELEGLGAGDKKEGVIEAIRAFGSEEQQPKKTISRQEFPGEAKLEVGAQFAAKSETGQDVILRVVKFDDDHVEVRLVHPLADRDISYEVEILKVTDTSPPPLPAEAIAQEDE